MCGRFAQKTPAKKLAQAFGVSEAPETEARYNIAPTQSVLSVRQTPDEREMSYLKWGLVPSWAKDPSVGARMINARSETVEEKPSFREAFKLRRCLVSADGFYEWARTAGRKQPYFFRLKDERPFAFAGLWERWQGQDGSILDSCTILTTEANEMVRPAHDRMPVILHPEDYELWLDDDLRKLELRRELLRPYPSAEMHTHAVSTLINSPRAQGAELTNIQISS